ncbi:hypothetical protein AL542_01875 [Grimontia hollisae]|uniref:GIY-YIG nuclease superfamily protein n=1 Tax=Grimontia hollisae TaxID=673 RepID=A0A377JAC0_GRIHO|nr:GIY-YIG nuclease family protein [Grimontia hollisae]AMG29217.1 hypothetical protein AL542_01875 [Grimontia hollisae]MDF2184914.1 GIY-YIG nuclease family protein [Grimontia hollisae]STO76658.1 GIY-YIG nuclease superfamily protein [Grimontia hollisae]STO98746.1 GIY-YIG nuclease superfamily protein [Grimontia hollisae]
MSLTLSSDIPGSDSPWYVYLIRARDNSLYCGVTTDVVRRLNEHQQNGMKTAKYLRGKQPLTLAWSYEAGTKQQAMSLEWKIKRLTKREKERLCKEYDGIQVLLNDRI